MSGPVMAVIQYAYNGGAYQVVNGRVVWIMHTMQHKEEGAMANTWLRDQAMRYPTGYRIIASLEDTWWVEAYGIRELVAAEQKQAECYARGDGADYTIEAAR